MRRNLENSWRAITPQIDCVVRDGYLVRSTEYDDSVRGMRTPTACRTRVLGNELFPVVQGSMASKHRPERGCVDQTVLVEVGGR